MLSTFHHPGSANLLLVQVPLTSFIGRKGVFLPAFLPLLIEMIQPEDEKQATRVVRHGERQYTQPGNNQQSVYLYHIEPAMERSLLQRRLRTLFDRAIEVLPPRSIPICEGIFLDTDTINSSHTPGQPNTLICPKKHIGSDVFDLVNVDTDCLKNPYLCHIMEHREQSIIPPFLMRVLDQG